MRNATTTTTCPDCQRAHTVWFNRDDLHQTIRAAAVTVDTMPHDPECLRWYPRMETAKPSLTVL